MLEKLNIGAISRSGSMAHHGGIHTKSKIIKSIRGGGGGSR